MVHKLKLLCSCKINDCRNDGSNDNPEELEPIKERDSDKLRTSKVVEGGPEQDDEGENEKQAEPASVPAFRMSNHNEISFTDNEKRICCSAIEACFL